MLTLVDLSLDLYDRAPTFGPDPNAGCPQVRDMLALMDTPAPSLKPAPAPMNRSA